MLLLNTDLIYMHVVKYLFDKANENNIDYNDKKVNCLGNVSYLDAYTTSQALLEEQKVTNKNPFTFEQTEEVTGIILPITTGNFVSNTYQTYNGYGDEDGIIRLEFLVNDEYLEQHLQAIDNFKKSLAIIKSYDLEQIFNEIWEENYAPLYQSDQENLFKGIAEEAFLTIVVDTFNPSNRKEIIEGQRIYGVEMTIAFDYTKGYAQSNFMKYEIKRLEEGDSEYRTIPIIMPTEQLQTQPEGIMYLDKSRMEQVTTASSTALSIMMFIPARVEPGNLYTELLGIRYNPSNNNEQLYNIRITMPYLEIDSNNNYVNPTFEQTYCVGGVKPVMIPGQKFTMSIDFVVSMENE